MLAGFLTGVGIFMTICCSGQTYAEQVKRAEAAYGRNQLDSCIYYFNNAFAIGDAKGSDLYNAAVCNTLKGNSNTAFELLNSAIEKGLNFSKLRIDPDLETLHNKRDWKRLLKKARKIQKNEFRKTQFPKEAQQLSVLWEKDQYWRFRLGKAYAKNDTITANEIWKKLKPTDSVNLILLQSIMDRIGWPTITKVGKSGANTAFLIIDHSPREIMEKYFPLLETAAKNGEASLSSFATMKDRILVNRGKNQIYGTQRYWDAKANKFVFFPIEDEKSVNERRKEVGLTPLQEFNE